ncbi:MAG TPA: metallophosphoesterase [Polyangiaceae bacterium]
MAGRTVVVGDVHGCTGELEELLERVRFVEGKDRLVLVGDLLVRGPDTHGVLALVRRVGARAVRGNHEEKLLAWRRGRKALGSDHERVAKVLTDDDWRLLGALPLWLDLPEHDARIVHAGVVPGVAVDATPAEALLKMRTLDARGAWSDDADAGPLWGTRYTGPPHVVFGHNARPEPQLHAWATGLDTGCVYGGKLTALVLDEGEPMPRGDAVRPLLKSVPAMRKYFGGKGSPLER